MRQLETKDSFASHKTHWVNTKWKLRIDRIK